MSSFLPHTSFAKQEKLAKHLTSLGRIRTERSGTLADILGSDSVKLLPGSAFRTLLDWWKVRCSNKREEKNINLPNKTSTSFFVSILPLSPSPAPQHIMAGKKAAGENTKKAAGNAQKAESAAAKKAVEDQKKSKAEAEEWSKGAKSNSKK